MKYIFLTFISLVISINSIFAAVSLPSFYTDNMVLQREQAIIIKGWASKGEIIKVIFNNKEKSTTTNKNGAWAVSLDAMNAGGPYEMTIKGTNEIHLVNILIGDVWICSGQSNMEFNVKQFDWAKRESDSAQYPEIRLLKVEKQMLCTTSQDVKTSSTWKTAEKDNIMNFSAVAYFYGRYLYQKEKIPIGLIMSAWGGTNIEAWTSYDGLLRIPDMKNTVSKYARSCDVNDKKSIQNYEDWKKKNLMKDIGLDQQWNKLETDISDWKDADVPCKYEALGLKTHIGSVWFRRTFDLPIQFRDQDLDLRLGKIENYCQVWVNGIMIGNNLGKDRWVAFDIPKAILKSSNNDLVIRIVSLNEDGGFLSDADNLNFYRKGNNYGFVFLSGIWQYKVGSSMKAITVPDLRSSNPTPNTAPSSLYNGMISGLVGFPIKGFIWYQGESNAPRAEQYRTLFPNMILDWREKWNMGDLPFIYVQLANFKKVIEETVDAEWAELREAQDLALKLPNVGSAVTIDIGDANNIHPLNKQDVGKRLGLAALKIAYHKDIVFSGPTYHQMFIEGDRIKIIFKNTGSGLIITDKYGYLKGFSIAGDDKKFYWAKAFYDENNDVFVFSDKIKKPIAVRYGWSDNPDDVNLYNQEGLPASPFRTDSWDGITKNKKFKLE